MSTIISPVQVFLKDHILPGEKVELPIPTIYFSSFMGDGVNDCLVIENLCADRHFQVSWPRLKHTRDGPTEGHKYNNRMVRVTSCPGEGEHGYLLSRGRGGGEQEVSKDCRLFPFLV